jgi:glycosyltransferase involved in cell wall biosynthesis
LDHVINQEYRNLEIIIADDVSTDGSREICREYAQKDSRIRYFENRHNLGAGKNISFVFQLSSGDFYVWVSGHDNYDYKFVCKMLEIMKAYPSVVMCCPKTFYYRPDGTSFKPPALLDTRGLSPVERVKHLIEFRMAGGSMDIYYGLFRSDVLAKVKTDRDFVSADEIFLAEMCFLGEFLQIDEVLIEKLDRSEHKGNPRRSREAYRAHLDALPLSKGSIIKEYTPRLASYIEYMNMIEFSGASHDGIEYLGKVIAGEAHVHKKYISDEVENFIEHFKNNVLVYETDSMIKKIWTLEVHYILGWVKILGLLEDKYIPIMDYCLSHITSSLQ